MGLCGEKQDSYSNDWVLTLPCVLFSSDRFIDLQIPPDTGNGSWNAGVPLARLFWHLPAASLMGLLQALLLERRILMVAQEKDTLSAALHAAAALLYPFSWHHIYLPLLPHNLKVPMRTNKSLLLNSDVLLIPITSGPGCRNVIILLYIGLLDSTYAISHRHSCTPASHRLEKHGVG